MNIKGSRKNGICWRDTTGAHTLASGGIFDAANTDRIHRLNADGTWSSYRHGRAINGFTTLEATNGTNGPRAGRMYLVDALQDITFNTNGQLPLWIEDDGDEDLDPTTLADDVTPWLHNHGADKVPNFALFSGTVVSSTQSGNWSAGATWVGGSAPAADTIVRIRSGHTVTYDLDNTTRYKVVSVENGGTLAFSVAGDTYLRVIHLVVRETGTLTIGTVASPVPNGNTAIIEFANVALDTTNDPAQFGNGLVVFGTLRVCGFDRGSSYIRVSAELSATDTTIPLAAAATNWQVGDRIAIPDTRQLASGDTFAAQLEVRTIASKSGDNLTLTLNSALTYDHIGPRNASGTLLAADLFHVVNLTCNVIFRSENVAVPGHAICMTRADVDIRNALFFEMGRTNSASLDNTTFTGDTATHIGTNQIGRYPFHLHHVGGRTAQSNGYQFTLLSNAIDGGDDYTHVRKWGITLHGSHFGLVQNNALFNVFGGGYVFEDGSESGNLVKENIACLVNGGGGREDLDDAETGFARNGGGFWMRSVLNHFQDNVAANCGGYGLILNAISAGAADFPTYQGSFKGNGSVSVSVQQVGSRELSGLETYGNGGGVTYWHWNTNSDTPLYVAPRTVAKDFVIWNIAQWGCYGYPNCHITLDGWRMYGIAGHLANDRDTRAMTWHDDYRCQNFIIKNLVAHNFKTGILCSPDLYDSVLIEDSEIHCGVGVQVQIPVAAGTSGDQSAAVQREHTVTVRNCDLTVTAEAVNTGVIPTKCEVGIFGGPSASTMGNWVVPYQFYFYERNGQAAENYRIYSTGTDADFVLPQSTATLYACPEADLTNTQAWAKYEPWEPGMTGLDIPVKSDNPNPNTPGLAFAGAIAPAGATTESWAIGLVESL